MKTVVCWGMSGNVFISYVPDWRCKDIDGFGNVTDTHKYTISNGTNDNSSSSNISDTEHAYWNQQCKTSSGKKCTSFEYDSHISTLVNQVYACIFPAFGEYHCIYKA